MLKQVQHDDKNIKKAHLKFKWAFYFSNNSEKSVARTLLCRFLRMLRRNDVTFSLFFQIGSACFKVSSLL